MDHRAGRSLPPTPEPAPGQAQTLPPAPEPAAGQAEMLLPTPEPAPGEAETLRSPVSDSSRASVDASPQPPPQLRSEHSRFAAASPTAPQQASSLPPQGSNGLGTSVDASRGAAGQPAGKRLRSRDPSRTARRQASPLARPLDTPFWQASPLLPDPGISCSLIPAPRRAPGTRPRGARDAVRSRIRRGPPPDPSVRHHA